MDWYNASLGIVAGILILIIAVGLFVTRRKKTKPAPPRKKRNGYNSSRMLYMFGRRASAD